MRYYQLFFITAIISEQEKESLLEKIDKIIQKNNGTLEEMGVMKKTVFGYEIEKQKRGCLGSCKFYFSSDKIENFKKDLKKIEEIIRFIIIKERKYSHFSFKEFNSALQQISKKERVDISEIDKKLEEILETKSEK